ncbi:MAG: DMT family transporter [Bacteroidales bacterium]|nr:DMT family transporter [Bacteroidales bacterium]MBQ5416324.1 DMT family transporter [Bacteroidales bacterium]
MWLWMTLGSALMLGIYDVFKKQALKNNSVLWVLLAATALSTLFLSPFLSSGPVEDHLRLVLKAVLVTTSWVSGLIGLKLLPITTVSTLKASRPFFVVLFSIVLFGEQLNGWQWAGVALALLALTLLSGASKKEGIDFSKSKGVAAMAVSILAGVASALYDKKVVASMDPLFLQSWCNFYITVLLALCILVKSLRDKENRERFKWDWMLVVIAVFITGADMLYFFALKQDGALLSVISLMRRCSVVVTFVVGAIVFKEKNLKAKSLDLAILLAGIVCLVLGSQ